MKYNGDHHLILKTLRPGRCQDVFVFITILYPSLSFFDRRIAFFRLMVYYIARYLFYLRQVKVA